MSMKPSATRPTTSTSQAQVLYPRSPKTYCNSSHRTRLFHSCKTPPIPHTRLCRTLEPVMYPGQPLYLRLSLRRPRSSKSGTVWLSVCKPRMEKRSMKRSLSRCVYTCALYRRCLVISFRDTVRTTSSHPSYRTTTLALLRRPPQTLRSSNSLPDPSQNSRTLPLRGLLRADEATRRMHRSPILQSTAFLLLHLNPSLRKSSLDLVAARNMSSLSRGPLPSPWTT